MTNSIDTFIEKAESEGRGPVARQIVDNYMPINYDDELSTLQAITKIFGEYHQYRAKEEEREASMK